LIDAKSKYSTDYESVTLRPIFNSRISSKTRKQAILWDMQQYCLLTVEHILLSCSAYNAIRCVYFTIDVKYVDPKNKKRKKRVFYEKNKTRKKRKMKNVTSKLFTPIEKQHQDNTVTPLNYCNLLN